MSDPLVVDGDTRYFLGVEGYYLRLLVVNR